MYLRAAREAPETQEAIRRVIFNFGSQVTSLWTSLGPLLLFGASLAATGVAFFGILKSNKTNREAIAAAVNARIAYLADLDIPGTR